MEREVEVDGETVEVGNTVTLELSAGEAGDLLHASGARMEVPSGAVTERNHRDHL